MGRKKLDDRGSFHTRVADTTPDELKKIALAFGYVRGGEGSIGQLLDAIASGEITLKKQRGEYALTLEREVEPI